jgi:ubiquinol oxidase
MAPHAPQSIPHHAARGASDHVALALTKLLRWFADAFFAKRYGHRAVVLETIAGVPGMVGGMMNHLKSLRLMRDDEGWIKTLLDEAENERMHLMTFIALFKPSWFERLALMLAQAIFWNGYFFLYLFSPKTAHRMVGYFEEEAVVSYTAFLAEIDAGRFENVAAPELAIAYWKLSPDARLRDVVFAVREDEAGHRDVNHAMSDQLRSGETPWRRLAEETPGARPS